MAYWLFKEEPDHYSLENLFRDKRAAWDGVENNLALKHLRSVKKGGPRPLLSHRKREGRRRCDGSGQRRVSGSRATMPGS